MRRTHPLFVPVRRSLGVGGVVVALVAGHAVPAFAQRMPFERTLAVSGPATLDVSTMRGTIEITAGDPGRIVVAGAVTVRIGWNVPSDAVAIAQRIAANPPVTQEASTVRLRAPVDPVEQRAVTVNYQVRVPPDTRVITVTDSGATTVDGVHGPVEVRTQSSAIELMRLGKDVAVKTGSGAVSVDGAGDLRISTGSSAVTARNVSGALHVRTESGAVNAWLIGGGDVDVHTGSSAMELQGVKGGLTASTRSGRIVVSGKPQAPWQVTTGSSAVDVTFEAASALTVDATTGSGSVKVDGGDVHGTVSKGRVSGTIGGGGPLVRVSSRSGSIRLSKSPS